MCYALPGQIGSADAVRKLTCTPAMHPAIGFKCKHLQVQHAYVQHVKYITQILHTASSLSITDIIGRA